MNYLNYRRAAAPNYFSLLSLVLVVLIFVNFVSFSNGNAGGGPTTDENCKLMIPQHKTDPQKGPCPYTIYLSKSEVRPAEMVRIMIYSSLKRHKVKGFFLQGRKFYEDSSSREVETVAMGSFEIDENYKGSKLVNCGGVVGMNNTMTHADSGDKDHVRAVWMAPKEPGNYVILCTIVKNGNVFWTKQPSLKIVVTS